MNLVPFLQSYRCMDHWAYDLDVRVVNTLVWSRVSTIDAEHECSICGFESQFSRQEER